LPEAIRAFLVLMLWWSHARRPAFGGIIIARAGGRKGILHCSMSFWLQMARFWPVLSHGAGISLVRNFDPAEGYLPIDGFSPMVRDHAVRIGSILRI
jgi:hypothetical protein